VAHLQFFCVINTDIFNKILLVMYCYNGYEFRADPEMGQRLKNGTYEKDEIYILNKLDIKDCTVLEVGGCLGVLSTIINKKLNNPQNHVVIDANPELIDTITYNKLHNNCKFKIDNCIISKNGSHTMFTCYDKAVAGSAHRRDNWEKNPRKYEIKNKTLDDYDQKFDVMVIDIEGGELQFLYENCEYIKKNIKYVMLEIHEHMMFKNFERMCIDVLENLCSMKLEEKVGCTFLFKRSSPTL
jgi:FkbM family methyltransferase